MHFQTTYLALPATVTRVPAFGPPWMVGQGAGKYIRHYVTPFIPYGYNVEWESAT
jgi:hypothetical protein